MSQRVIRCPSCGAFFDTETWVFKDGVWIHKCLLEERNGDQMFICSHCRKVMICMQNGVKVVWRNTWVKSADAYNCPSCGNTILDVNDNGYHVDDATKEYGSYIVRMPDK